MWRFQRAKHKLAGFLFVRRKHLFMSQLLLVSLLFHGLVMVYLFIFYNGYRYSTKLVVTPMSVSLLPTSVVRPASTSMHSAVQTGASKPASPQKITKTPSTTIRKESPKKVVAPPKKPAPKPQVKDTGQKAKPQEQAPKKVTQKEQPKQQQKKPAPAEKKSAEQKKAQEPQQQQVNEQQLNQNQVGSGQTMPAAQPRAVEDYDTPQIQQYVQNEISQKWTPPIGLPEDLMCEIIIQVGNDGSVEDSKIEKSSGVLIYDLSARSAASSLSLPRWAWGREFTISFNQL